MLDDRAARFYQIEFRRKETESPRKRCEKPQKRICWKNRSTSPLVATIFDKNWSIRAITWFCRTEILSDSLFHRFFWKKRIFCPHPYFVIDFVKLPNDVNMTSEQQKYVNIRIFEFSFHDEEDSFNGNSYDCCRVRDLCTIVDSLTINGRDYGDIWKIRIKRNYDHAKGVNCKQNAPGCCVRCVGSRCYTKFRNYSISETCRKIFV